MPLYITNEKITELSVEAIVVFKAGDRAGLDLIPYEDQMFTYVLRVGFQRDGHLSEDWRLGLSTCCNAALDYAVIRGLQSVAIPLAVGEDNAADGMVLACEVISAFLQKHDLTVFLTTQAMRVPLPDNGLFRGVAQRIAQIGVSPAVCGLESEPYASGPLCRERLSASVARPAPAAPAHDADADMPDELVRQLHTLDAGFSEMLLRMIDERGMTDPECYRRANVDRKLFSKIRSNPSYTPKKTTAVALCIALRLDMVQMQEMLSRAGYGMSRSNHFDVIVEYFVNHGVFDVHVINQALWSYDQPLLGSGWREE